MFDTKITKGKILQDITVFTPSVNYDERGSIFTTYDNKTHNDYLPEGLNFIHDKFSESKHNVLRGLHGDTKTWKLITCVYGELFEAVVDMRKESTNYLHSESFLLNSTNKTQILVPPYFVNGFYVLSEFAVFHYKLAYEGKYFDVGDQIVIKWNDPKININWPCRNPILQNRDK